MLQSKTTRERIFSKLLDKIIVNGSAKSFGLPYLNAYLDSLGTEFKQGANFATAASTIRLPDQIIPGGGFSPFYLDVQYTQFVRLLKSAHRKTTRNIGTKACRFYF